MVSTARTRRTPRSTSAPKIAKTAPAKQAAKAVKTASKGTRWNDVVQQQLSDTKRLALIRTAGATFKAKGFHHTSLDEVAAALNVTKPTLYYYVDNKQDLLYRCHDHALDLGEEALLHAQEGTTGLDKLQRMLARYIELMTDEFAAYSLLSDLNDMVPKHRQAIQKRRRSFDTRFRTFVSEGIADGSVRDCNPMLAVAWFMGAVNGIPRWYDPRGSMNGAAVAAAYTDFITRGLKA